MPEKEISAFMAAVNGGQTSIPIVFGGAGLGLIRSLGEKGIKSIVVDDGPVINRDFSKYCMRVSVPDISKHPEEAMAHLRNLCLTLAEHSGKLPVLFPVSDYALDFITEHYSSLHGLARAGCAPLKAIRIALNKVSFYEWLEGNAFPGPKVFFTNRSRKEEVNGHGIQFPCIIKPEYTYRLEKLSGKKLYLASDEDQLNECCEAVASCGMGYVVQEIVPGRIEDQYAIGGYSGAGGDIQCYMMTNKVRQSDFGAGSFVKSAHVPELLGVGQEILHQLEYTGIFEIEFKRDARDALFKIIEFNPRCWSQIALATRAKVNVAYHAYSDLCNGSARTTGMRGGSFQRKFWVNLEPDLGHIKRKALSGDFSFMEVIKVLASVPCVEPFDTRDVKPGLFYLRNKIVRKLKTIRERSV